jgi:hypothetical protein
VSVLTLPEPANWPAGGRRFGWVTLGVAASVATGISFGIRAVLRGDFFLAAMLFGLQVLFVLMLIGIHLVACRRSSLNADVGSRGTTLRPDRTLTWILSLMIASFIPLGIYCVVCTQTGDLEMFTGPGARLSSLIPMSFVTVLCTWALVNAWARGGVGYVKLTPNGVEIADILCAKFVAWHEVVAINDHSESKRTRKPIVLVRADSTEQVIEGADFYVPEGVGLHWMVRHYWQHSDDRVELADGRALQRLSEGQF